jgi:hypothetical protein
LYKRAGKFIKLTGRERVLFLDALVLHLWVGLVLKVIPFRLIPKLFSSQQYTDKSLQSAEELELIREAILRAGMASPWKNRCLVSSLAGRCMLRRRKIPSQLSLGVAKNAAGKTIAHAWISTGDVEIVFADKGFQELYHF